MSKTVSALKVMAALVCACGILFTACKKQEIQGPKGDPGDPGIGGNANIVSTNTFMVNSASWVADTVAECLKVTISFPTLTQDVVEKGGVKVYRQTGTVWSELPITTTDLFTQFGFDVGNLYLNYINIEGGLPGSPPPTERYRMVIISEVQKNAFPYANDGKYVNIEKTRAITK